MSRSEFRFNKKRKHYAYLHKDIGNKRKNILISTKPVVKEKKHHKQRIINNVALYHHPNSNKAGIFYIIPRNYLDETDAFSKQVYKWNWNKNDKRKIKRIKKMKK